MNDVINRVFNIIGDVFKLIIVASIIIITLQTLSLHIAVYKTMQQGERDGYLSQQCYRDNINKVFTDTSNISVVEVKPMWGNKVKKLGGELYLSCIKYYTFIVFGKTVKVGVPVKVHGINQGYYGEGY